MSLVIDELFETLQKSEHAEYFGEAVSQLQHALQAAQCARDAKADDELIIAALLHDIGHLVASEEAAHAHGVGVIDHDAEGAEYLRERGFSDRVAALVAGHVMAKRYLTATNPGYLERLSPASTQTLELQGGPLTPEEAEAFEQHALFRQMLQLRSWDEQAKRTDWEVSPLETYRGMIEAHLRGAEGK